MSNLNIKIKCLSIFNKDTQFSMIQQNPFHLVKKFSRNVPGTMIWNAQTRSYAHSYQITNVPAMPCRKFIKYKKAKLSNSCIILPLRHKFGLYPIKIQYLLASYHVPGLQ